MSSNEGSAAHQKIKKLKSRVKPSKRKRRTNSEKHIEERDDEIPWPPPNESAIALYNQLINADFKLKPLDQLSSTPLTAPIQKSINNADDLTSVHKKLDQLLIGGHSKNLQNAVQNHVVTRNVPVTVETASSDDMCTLFTKSCHVPCTTCPSSGRGPLPPIGVFWDIENCSVPKGRSALVAVQRIRDRFFPGHYEAEFVCVCDIRKESPGVIQELNDAQVSVIHVSGNSKNAADDKLRQSMRRFADVYSGHNACPSSPFPATIVLISGDINFSTDLSDLRHRKRLYVILLHNKHAPEALLLCAHEQFEFHSLLTHLPFRPTYRENLDSNKQIPLKGGLQAMDVMVCDLPYSTSKTQAAIKNRLRKLSENCGGKVVTLQGQFALVRFPNKEAAMRATKRMNGEDVLGSKIRVVYSSQMEFQSSQIGNTSVPRTKDSSLNQSWKPTWKNKSLEASTSRPAAGNSCQNQTKNQVSFHNSTATPASNSSSPFESSREPSPTNGRQQPLQVGSSHSTPLNNTVQALTQQQTMIPLNTNSAFAFHQNLFPMQHIGVSPSNCTQLSQQQQENGHVQQKTNDFCGTPRLYSTPFAPRENSNIPLNLNGVQSNSQNDILAHLTPISSSARLYPVSTNGVNGSASSSQLINTPPAPFQFGNSPMSSMKNKQDLDYFDLHVTNIDPALGDWKVVRHSLITAFGEHVGVKCVWVYISQDGSVSAVVRVNNKEEAHYAVAQLHRKKLGNKRIFISFDQGGNVDQETLKKEVATLLLDVPGSSLPLFKFREMFEKRYRRSVSSSDLYRLRDVVAISENGNQTSCFNAANIGRTISLSSEWKSKEDKDVTLYCMLHPPSKQKSDKNRTGWAEKEAEILLPNVMVELKTLSERVHALLNSHAGCFPLISFLDCYEAEFEAMEIASSGSGVPLEHLLSCVQGVEITYSENGMKRVKWSERKEVDTGLFGQPLATQLAQFGREMVDLLKTFPRCSLAFSKLIPAYHHHFGRQCRVADYGHFNLQSLLQTLPHVIQVMGAAQNRILTLSHRAQMKRFATDLLRVLKAHGGVKKQIKVEEFPQAFSQVFANKQFCPEDYGLSYFSDLISELIENSTLVALVKDEEGNQMLAVPKREQTPQEIHRTRIFASEVIELFRHSIRYEMPFSKFIPAYHHHFGKQCRVSDYGFSKLAELFEAINDTVICVGSASAPSDCNIEDKLIRLIPQEQLKVIGDQLSQLVEKQTKEGRKVRLDEVDELFIQEHGFQLRPEMCDADSIEDLIMNKLASYIKVQDGYLTAVDQNEILVLSQDISTILGQYPDYKMDLVKFLDCLLTTYDVALDVATIKGSLSQLLILSESEDGKQVVSLSPLRIFAKEITQILDECGGSLLISSLETIYLQKFNQPLRPAQMGYPSILALIQAIPDVVQVRGKHRAKRVCLVGQETSETSSLEESFRSQRSHRYMDGFRDNKSNGKPHSSSVERPKNFGNGQLRVDTGRWTDSPKLHRRIPGQLFTPTMSSPSFHARAQTEPTVFTFDRSAPISPPVYDLWMRDTMSPGSPPLSPPVVWTYHPIVYPPNTPPANSGNIMMPTHFSYAPTGPWSPAPMASACFDRLSSQGSNVMGNEFMFEQQNRLARGMDGRNEV